MVNRKKIIYKVIKNYGCNKNFTTRYFSLLNNQHLVQYYSQRKKTVKYFNKKKNFLYFGIMFSLPKQIIFASVLSLCIYVDFYYIIFLLECRHNTY